jgi:hypothetical protein
LARSGSAEATLSISPELGSHITELIERLQYHERFMLDCVGNRPLEQRAL